MAAACAGLVVLATPAPRAVSHAQAAGSSAFAAASDPVVAAAGDIACDPLSTSFNGGDGTATACRQKATSDLLLDPTLFPDLAAVLALGDLQYENGAYAKFLDSYEPSWGRVKSFTRPVPGNHEYATPGAAGYYQYFGAGRGRSGEGLLQLRPRRLAPRRAELELRFGRRLWQPARLRSSGYAADLAASGATLHARVLAPSALLVGRPWQRRQLRRLLAALYDGRRRSRPGRPRPLLRAVCAAGSRRARGCTGPSGARCRHRRRQPVHLHERPAEQRGPYRAEIRRAAADASSHELRVGTHRRARSGRPRFGLDGVQFRRPARPRDDRPRRLRAHGPKRARQRGRGRGVERQLQRQDDGAERRGAHLRLDGGQPDVQAWTPPPCATTWSMLALVRLNAANPVGAGYQARIMARAQADTRNGYSARISHATTGALTWTLSRINSPAAPDRSRLRAGRCSRRGAPAPPGGSGSASRARASRSSTGRRTRRAATWRAAVTDSYWASGRAGFGAFVNSGLATPFPDVGWRSFSAVDAGAPPPAPTAPAPDGR